MEKINTEMFVNSLFVVGFDKVDPVLFTFVLGKLTSDDKENVFFFESDRTEPTFNKYVDYDRVVFKLKDGYSIDQVIEFDGGAKYPLKKVLNTNRKLVEYLENLDYTDIVLRKAEIYGIKDLNSIDKDRFSAKEIEILKSINYGQEETSLNYKLEDFMQLETIRMDNQRAGYQDAYHAIGLGELLGRVFERTASNPKKSFSISSLNSDDIYGFSGSMNKFMNLFDEDECLALSFVKSPTMADCKDFVFLLDDNTMLTIREVSASDCPGDVRLSAIVSKIGDCKGDSFKHKLYYWDSMREKECTKYVDAFTFRDKGDRFLPNIYETNDKLKSYDGLDIRDVLKPITLESIADRIMNAEFLKKGNVRQRI